MMTTRERIFNLFFYSNLDIIKEVGVVSHDFEGTDESKIKFLRDNVETDFIIAQKYALPEKFKIKVHDKIYNGIDFTTYRDLCSNGQSLLIFDHIIDRLSETTTPLVVITPIRDGKIFIEGNEAIKSTTEKPPEVIHIEKQKDWYSEYIDSKGFHFDRLINDDFFEAIRLTFNAHQYVSSMKLLMICIDTISYLEYGDTPKNFQNWINKYTRIDMIDIESEELWEFRNSILHMTNLDSRKVTSGSIKRLLFYVSKPGLTYPKETDEGKYFNFKQLIDRIAEGIANWAESYNISKDKFETLLNRYDRIVSDKRMTYIYYENKYSR